MFRLIVNTAFFIILLYSQVQILYCQPIEIKYSWLDNILEPIILNGESRYGVFIKFKEGKFSNSEQLDLVQSYNGTIESRLSNEFVTALIPKISVIPIKNNPDVESLGYSFNNVELELDQSAEVIAGNIGKSVANVHGNNIVVGIIDTGIDPNHEDFKSDNGSRIIKFWDQTFDGNPPFGYSYGSVFDANDINNASYGGALLDDHGHGTHVAGIAVGNGRATGNSQPNNVYVGTANEADILAVKFNKNQNGIVDGLLWISSIADALNKPWVINLSLGSFWGPRNATSLFEQSVDFIIDHNSGLGEVIVKSAGNKKGKQLVSSKLNTDESTFILSDFIENINDEYFLIEMWYPNGTDFKIKLETPNDAHDEWYSNGEGTFSPGCGGLITTDGAISIHNNHFSDSELNCMDPFPNVEDNQIIIVGQNYYLEESDTWYNLENGDWKIKMEPISGSGRWDAFIYQDNENKVNFSVSDTTEQYLITEPGNALEILTVGSMNSKNEWINVAGDLEQRPNVLNEISVFSSLGPTRDGRPKPDIYVPGSYIASTKSNNIDFSLYSAGYENDNTVQDGQHIIMQGTSMAAPHVTGAVALLLEQNSSLSNQQIKSRIIETANYEFGYPIINIHDLLCVNNNYCQYSLGDVNHNGLVELEDLILIVNHILSVNDLVLPYLINADLNQDGLINITDVLALIYIILENDSIVNTSTIAYLSGTIESIENGERFKYSIDMLNEQDVYILHFELQFNNKIPLHAIKGIRSDEMNISHNIKAEDYKINVMIFSPEGRKIPSGYGTILEIELESTALGRDGELTDGSEFIITDLANNPETLIPVEIVSAEELSRLADIKTSLLPTEYNLNSVYPNPFNPKTTITYDLPEETYINISIYDLAGRKVDELVSGLNQPGQNNIIWNADQFSSGVYFVTMTTPSFTSTQKVVLLK